MRHVDLNRCSEELWFANPDPPPTYLADVMRERRSSDNWVPIGFNDLFTTILYAMRRHKSPEEFVPRSREHSGGSITVKLRVLNRLGIHTAAAAKIIKLTNKFHCEMFLRYDGFEINVKSLIGIMTLGVTYGKEVELYIEGDDCEQAAKEMKALFDNKFYEED
jgi:phosphocarrier protein